MSAPPVYVAYLSRIRFGLGWEWWILRHGDDGATEVARGRAFSGAGAARAARESIEAWRSTHRGAGLMWAVDA